MKKICILALAFLVLMQAVGFAALVPTITSRQRYTDDAGNERMLVVGTLAFDSTYPCNNTTGQCGEALPPSKMGLETVDAMFIEPYYSASAAGVLLFRYLPHGTPPGATDVDQPNVRAYYWGKVGGGATSGLTAGAFVSSPTYDLSALTAVPFLAVGS